MKEFAEFPKIRADHALLLTLVTFGMYIPFWFLSRRQLFERYQIKLPYIAIKVTVLLFAFSMLESFWASLHYVLEDVLPYGDNILLRALYPAHSFLPQVSFLLFCFVNIRSCFRIRKALLKRQLKTNGVMTFLFNVTYLQHLINKQISEDHQGVKSEAV
ncbi:hypothetical protein M654_000810 [Bacillus sp. NSP9.1]|nr:hypothetical protein M654_000810 [Bacillus sp. NSP9.1]